MFTKVNKTYKVPLNLNNKENSSFFEHANAARFVWNWGLEYLNKNYAAGNKYINFVGMSRIFNSIKAKEFPLI